MKQCLIALLSGVLLSANMFSQTDFRAGYIVKTNNDTIYGLLDYKSNVSNSRKCIFKKDENSEKLTFTPEDLLAYRFIDGKYYVSKEVDNGEKKELLFLEFLINGIVDIYFYQDLNMERFLVDKGDGRLVLLKNESKEVTVNNINYIKESKEYIGVLKYVFYKSPSINKKIESVSLDSKSLINITKEYHNEVCTTEECIVYEKKIPKTKILLGFGIITGLNSVDITIGNSISDANYYLKNSNFKDKLFPSVGFIFNLNMPYLNKNLFLEYEGTFGKWNLSSHYSYLDPASNMIITNDISLKQNSFNNLISLKYKYPKGIWRPTIKAGFFRNYFFHTDYLRKSEARWSWGDFYSSGTSELNPFFKSDYGLGGGLGFNAHFSERFVVLMDFEYKRGFNILENYKSQKTNIYSVNFGVQFGK